MYPVKPFTVFRHLKGTKTEQTTNKKRRRKIMRLHSFAIILAGLLFFSSTLDAQMRGGFGDRGERGFRGERPDRIRVHERLDLTSEQEAQLSEFRTQHQKQMIDKRAEVQKLRLSIREEMRQESPDMSAIENMVEQQGAILTEMMHARVSHWNNVRDVLTPEQREIWQQYRRGFGEFGDRRGSGRRGYRGR